MTSLLALPLAGAIWAPPWALLAVLVLGEVGMAWEGAGLLRLSGLERLVLLGSGVALAVASRGGQEALLAATLLVLCGQLLLCLRGDPGRVLRLMGATAYLGLLPCALMLIRLRPEGRRWLMALVAAVFCGDSAAYLVGRRWGRRPLHPLSPRKTVEGSLAGLAAALLGGVACGWLLGLSPPRALLLAALAGPWGQLGDLVESSLKRAAGVKDAGGLLPGHGGLLDRADALLLAAPVAYLCLRAWGW